MTATDEVLAKLTAALAALPDSPDAIAAFLVERGIRSEPRDECFGRWCSSCPIALYLKQEIHNPVGVTPCTVTIFGVHAYDDAYVALPIPVSAFIGKMDRGAYPQLVKS